MTNCLFYDKIILLLDNLDLEITGSEMKSYPKYTWVGNRISVEDMAKLYQLKKVRGKPITLLVSEAVQAYLNQLQAEVEHHE